MMEPRYSSELQRKALEQKEERDKRKAERKYDRKEVPHFKKNLARLLSMARRASSKGMDFNLTAEWLDSKLSLESCEVTGIRFEGKGTDPFAMTIDRKDSRIGYVQDNCQAVVWIYNNAKSNFSHADLLVLVNALAAQKMCNNQSD